MRSARVLIPLTLFAVVLTGCNKADTPGTTPGGTGASVPATSAGPTPNGVADLSGAEILAKAKTALGAASSFRVKGDVNADGQKIGLDVKVKDKDLIGSIDLNGAKVELLRAGNDIHFKGAAEFWKTVDPEKGATIATLLNGRWAKAPSGNAGLADFAKIADPQELLKSEGSVTKGETKQINGVNAIALKDSSGNGALYIATEGEPYPLRLEGPSGQGALDFSDFGASVDIKAPTGAEVVDLSTLGG